MHECSASLFGKTDMPSKKEQDRGEIARRGDAIYDRKVRDAVSEEKKGQFVAIDVRSEDFGIGADDRTATKRLRTRHPEARVWLRRIGSRYARRFSARPRSKADVGK